MARLAGRFRGLRVALEPQHEFAARLGVSRPTLIRMEQGDPNQAIAYWVRALRLMGRLEEFEQLFAPPAARSLFDEVSAGAPDDGRSSSVRKRAKRRRR